MKTSSVLLGFLLSFLLSFLLTMCMKADGDGKDVPHKSFGIVGGREFVQLDPEPGVRCYALFDILGTSIALSCVAVPK